MAENSSVADIYQGGYSALDSNHDSLFTGYRGSVEQLGISTDPRSGNILKEFTDKLKPGQKIVELSLITPDVLEAIPKQHLKEIHRISKLTGVEPTVHGPLFDASGINQQGVFDESNREVIERKIFNTLERSHEMNPDGNMPVTFHSANALPAARYGFDKEGKEELQMVYSVNQDTGQISPVEKKELYVPEIKEGVPTGGIVKEHYDIEKQLRVRNNTEWDQSLQQLIVPKEHADRIISEAGPLLEPIMHLIQSGKITKIEQLTPEQQRIYTTHKSRFDNAQEQLSDIQTHLNSILDKGYKTYEKNGNDAGMAYLKNTVKEFSEKMKGGNYSQALQGFMEDLRPAALREIGGVPQTHISANEYAIKESAKTYGNAAWKSYKKFNDKSPIISIENPPATMGLSRAEDIKNMVEQSREQFVENATANGMGEKDAEKQAEKLIGATWDVGHINQLRQFGFSGKDIIKEAEIIAPLVKHVHLSDNFGMENTELPMGMGNVDLKEIMEKLGKQGEDARKIVEAAHWWQFQQTSPMAASLQAIGSPIYSMNMGPYWNEIAGLQQGYFGGLQGNWLPQINYETFGAGFSNLPQELGGQRPGAGGSRMGGRPME